VAAEAEASALSSSQRIHLVGIGGSGMSALAALLSSQGKRLTGSDLSSDAAERLRLPEIGVRVGHEADQVGEAELVITSAAIPAENPELVEARRRGLPILTHAQALGELMRSKVGVGVAGTHGKSTTTAMLGFVLEQAGLDPTVLVGANALNFGSGTRPGQGRHLVVEADEYDRRFLALDPWLAVLTGIEADHLDYYRDLAEIVGAFETFAARVAPDGVLVTCADDPLLAGLRLPRRRITYGQQAASDWRVGAYRAETGGGCRFELIGPSGRHQVQLQLSGAHNAVNAAGVGAAASALGVDPDRAVAALRDFAGTERRFQTVARVAGVWIVDDYAHHPTAVRATLAAAREVHAGRLWAVFQPHTTNRVAAMLAAFATCFQAADRLVLLPIFCPPGRERGARAVSSADLAARISRPPVSAPPTLELAEAALADELQPGDLVVVMGAGDVTRLSRGLAERLAARESAS
jgi:UDP-N-acetylmuramate--alanine ligase